MTDQKHIRNFCIIAHIDHGKSTLADRLLEYTGAVASRDMSKQLLDSMDLEQERGITIKLKAVRIKYQADAGEEYQLNLIDTPGHVDFNYEVSRSLAACEGALLVVDAAQGIEAQTLANVYLAMEHDLELIPVINKIDLPGADPERVLKEIEDVIGLDCSNAIFASAKTGVGTKEILESIVELIPPPHGKAEEPLSALIFDSHFDSYRGVIPCLRVVDGYIKKGMRIKMFGSGKTAEVTETGVFTPVERQVEQLNAGEVGYFAAAIKDVRETQVGDTVIDAANPSDHPLPGYHPATSMVYCGLYPVENNAYNDLKDALEKLQLNDAALSYEAESSAALGLGFRCGFLGLLHMEIVKERLEREYKLDLLITAPSVNYRVTATSGDVYYIDNPVNLPAANDMLCIEEPSVKATIMCPSDFIGAIMEIARERRGIFINMEYITTTRVMMLYELPLAEIIYDFFDQLKSRTRGYASLDYELSEYKQAELVKLDILVNDAVVDALSCIVHKDKAYYRGKALVHKLRGLIPRQLFEIPVQAAIGNKIISRENIAALRKDVTSKCYGGDISRKRKLLEKQKEGKKRMKQVGSVEIPQEAFMAVLKIDE